MGWSIGYDERWQRDIGYGVPAVCDHPECNAQIDRGLAYVCCDEQPHGGEGCGLFFCDEHRSFASSGGVLIQPAKCDRCLCGEPPYDPKPDVPEWVDHKETHESWAQWRRERDAEVKPT